MIKWLVLFSLISCSSPKALQSRGIASPGERTVPWVDADFDPGMCLQVDKDKLTTILPEIFLVEEYDRDYYYLTRHVPVDSERDFFENLTYEQAPTKWQRYSSLKISLKAAHSKFRRVSCPRLY